MERHADSRNLDTTATRQEHYAIKSKERMHAALEGRPVDRMPATVLYNQLYYLDHFAELTGKPAWQRHVWSHAAPDEHVAIFKQMIAQAPSRSRISGPWAPLARVRLFIDLSQRMQG